MWRWATEGKLHQFFFGSPFTVLFCWFVSTLPFFLTRLFSAFTHRRERSKNPGGRQSGRRKRERKPFYDFQIELPFRLPGLPRSKKTQEEERDLVFEKKNNLIFVLSVAKRRKRNGTRNGKRDNFQVETYKPEKMHWNIHSDLRASPRDTTNLSPFLPLLSYLWARWQPWLLRAPKCNHYSLPCALLSSPHSCLRLWKFRRKILESSKNQMNRKYTRFPRFEMAFHSS